MPNSKKEIKSGLYCHYKGKHYLVDKTVEHSETGEVMVVYQARYGDFSWWVRPLSMFFETVEVNGEQVARFQWISEKVEA